MPAWKGGVTKHSSNKGAEKDDGTGDIKEALKGKQGKLDADKDGKLAVMPKDKVKDKLGRSPDISDMLMMRMHFELRSTDFFVM